MVNIKLKCIKLFTIKSGGYGLLTVNKTYYLDKIGQDQLKIDAYVGSYSTYYLKGDDNEYRFYTKECFIDILEERNKKITELGI